MMRKQIILVGIILITIMTGLTCFFEYDSRNNNGSN